VAAPCDGRRRVGQLGAPVPHQVLGEPRHGKQRDHLRPDKDVEEIREFRRTCSSRSIKGVDRAFRTAFLGGGADIKVIGSSLKDLDAGNIRKQVHFDIALAAGINPMAVGLMEVNYSNTKEGNRSISDRKLRYLWMKAVEAFRPIVERPQGFELWYDVSGVAALQADAIG
jgi:phage portal protein BeeE